MSAAFETKLSLGTLATDTIGSGMACLASTLLLDAHRDIAGGKVYNDPLAKSCRLNSSVHRGEAFRIKEP